MIPYFYKLKKKWEKGEFLLRVEIQLTNAEGITDLEKHHLVTII